MRNSKAKAGLSALNKNEEILKKFKASIEYAPDGVFWINKVGGFDYINEQACKMLGYTYEELIQLKIPDIDPNASIGYFQQEWERLHNQKRFVTYSIESVHKRKDSTLYAVELSTTFIWDEGKSFFISYAKDISEQKEHENVLLKNQNLLQASQRIAKIGSWEHYLENDDMIWNKQTRAIFGHEDKNDKITFQTLNEYIHPQDRAKLEEHHTKLLQTNIFDDLEIRIVVQPGNVEKYIRIIGEIEFTQNKKPFRCFGTVQDVTEKELTLKALKASEQKLESVFNVLPVGIGLTRNRILYDLNPKICTITGYSKDELIGSHPCMLYQSEYEYNRVGNELSKNLKYKSDSSIETIWVRKDGKPVNVLIAVTLLDSLDESKGFVFTASDITEQKKVEEELLKNQTLLLESQRIAKIGSWELNLKTSKLYWNKEAYQLYGYKNLSIEPNLEVFYHLVHPDDKDFMMKHLEKVIKDKKYTDVECRIITPEGILKYIIVAGEIIFDDNNEPTRLFGIIQDITDRKLIEEERKKMNILLEQKVQERTIQLQQANKDLEAFAYSVSHDLRAPIRHIDGFLNLLKNNINPLDTIQNNYIDKVFQASNNMSVMIEELLRFSRYGRAEMHYEIVNLRKMLIDIVEQLKPDYEGRDLNWIINKLPQIDGDLVLLKIAFENLISNAIKYTAKKENAIIEIGERHINEANRVCIYIKDNGAGFDMAYKYKLFNVFQRLHKKEEFDGIGVGLANVQKIITKHNGEIDAIGEINNGATFYITLPIEK